VTRAGHRESALRHALSVFPSVMLLLITPSALQSQSLSPMPGSINDLSGQFPINRNLLFEQQIQAGTQGTPGNNGPYAYWHAVQIRPWFHYDGIRNVTLTASASYIDYFTISGTGNYAHPEWRLTVLGTLKQPLAQGSLYEQVRFELLNFRDSHGAVQHIPRVRFRFGQNLFLSESRARPYLGVYGEAILQFPQPSYSHVHFQGARFFAGPGFQWGRRVQLLMGFKAEAEVASSGSTVNLYYGPAFSLEFNFTHRPINEKHKSTTAFKDF
jgi:hypothetical protein